MMKIRPAVPLRTLLCAAALALAAATVTAQPATPPSAPCPASMQTFQEAYLNERLPVLLGHMEAVRFLARIVQRFRDTPELAPGWKAASKDKRLAFLNEVKEEAEVFTFSMERTMRRSLGQQTGYQPYTPIQCAPPELLRSYPDLPRYMEWDQKALPLALAMAIDGLPAVLDDDTPDKIAAHQQASEKVLLQLPPMPFQLQGMEMLTTLAGAAMKSRAGSADWAAIQAWSKAWDGLLQNKPRFFESAEEDALFQALQANRASFKRRHFTDKDQSSVDYYLSTTSRKLLKPFEPPQR